MAKDRIQFLDYFEQKGLIPSYYKMSNVIETLYLKYLYNCLNLQNKITMGHKKMNGKR